MPATTQVELIPSDPEERLKLILSESWKIFCSYFSNQKHSFTKEAPFQHHFANIMHSVGNLYCIRSNERFSTDLEVKHENLLGKGKAKYVDIVATIQSSPTEAVSCAIELKFKTKEHGAQDHGRIDAYVDLEALEHAVLAGHTFGRFYMITNSTTYINPPRTTGPSAGNIFATFNGHCTERNATLHCESKGKEDVIVNLKDEYSWKWQHSGDWFFLEMAVGDGINAARSTAREVA